MKFILPAFLRKRFIFIGFVSFCGLLAAAVGVAAAPPNDNFADAQIIVGSGSLAVSNVGATKEPNEPAHAFNRGGASVWYRYDVTADGVLRLRTSGMDTLLAVYTGTGLNDLKPVMSNDDDDPDNNGGSTIYLGLKTGLTYFIAVDGRYSDQSGTTAAGSFTFQYSFADVMPNDDFAKALKIEQSQPIVRRAFTNVGATKEAGEPYHHFNKGGRSVWFKWHSPAATVQTYTFRMDSTNALQPDFHNFPLFAIYTGSSLDTLTKVRSDCFYDGVELTFQAQPNVDYYLVMDGKNIGDIFGSRESNVVLTLALARSQKTADFDKDNRADLAVYRSTNGTFYSLDSTTDAARSFAWGQNGDRPFLCEDDKDGIRDYWFYRPSNQTWSEITSAFPTITNFTLGQPNDVPLIFNEYNASSGRSNCSPAVFTPQTGTWSIKRSPNALPITAQLGQSGDVPMTFDYDGDGTDEIAVYRPANGTWYLANPLTGQSVATIQFGTSLDVPVPADYFGRGRTEIAIFRPKAGTWFIRDSQTGTYTTVQLGKPGDKPQPADYDGDGKADPAVFHAGTWMIRRSSDLQMKLVQFGLATDIPVTIPNP